METNGHKWRVLAPFDVTPDDADQLVYGEDNREPTELFAGEHPDLEDRRPVLGMANIVREEMVVGCMNCEAAYSRQVAKLQCPGDPDGYGPDGTPLWGGKALYTGEEKTKTNVSDQVQVRPAERPGRNDPCYCGSGRKYKRCHGA